MGQSDVSLTFYYRSGTVESKIRHLVKQLEYVDGLSLAHPFVDSFDNVSYCSATSDDESQLVMTGNIPLEIAKRTKEEYENKADTLKVYTCSWFIGLLLEPKDREYSIAGFAFPGIADLSCLFQPILRQCVNSTSATLLSSLQSSSRHGMGIKQTKWASSCGMLKLKISRSS